MSLLCRLKNLVHKGLLRKEDLDRIVIIPKEPSDDTVSRGVFEQIKWERDIAIEQLEELGYGLGQKIESCDDYISRDKVLEGKVIHQSCDGVEIIDSYAVPVEYIEQLPPVTPKPKIDVLDKIRAEIEEYRDGMRWNNESLNKWEAINYVLEHIIDKYTAESSKDMNNVGVEIIKTEETEECGIKYLNINVSNSEVERKPDMVRLCSDAGIIEYAKPRIGHWIGNNCSECNQESLMGVAGKIDNFENKRPLFMYVHKRSNYCPNCGALMLNELLQESEDKE